MADSDPISEASPSAKRRKLQNGSAGKVWSSDDDSGNDLFDHETIATLPVTRPFTASQNQRSSQDTPSKDFSYITQPTQARTQLTYTSQLPSQDVQVQRSSPVAATPQQHLPPPPPITKAPFSKPSSLLAGVANMAPRGTALRRPGLPPKKEVVEIDSDMSDPPVEHSSGEESRGLTSNIKPTQFIRGGRALDSSPNHIVRDSPRPDYSPSIFSDLVSQYKRQQADDLTSSYAGTSRGPRALIRKPGPVVMPTLSGLSVQNLDDIEDFRTRNKVERMQGVLGRDIPVARCLDALRRKHMNYEDALNFLVDDGAKESDMIDDLAPTPFKKALRLKELVESASQKSSQPAKPLAKQSIKAPVQSIAARYATKDSTHGDGNKASKPSVIQLSSDSAEEIRPERRLLKNRRPRPPSPEVRTTGKRPVKKNIVDDDSDEEAAASTPEPEVTTTGFDRRVLDFFNTSGLQDIVDLSDQPPEDVELLVSKRPFNSLGQIADVIREFDGENRKKPRIRRVGEIVLNVCVDMLTGYEAVDDLVSKCEKLAKPIQDSLKAWGVGAAADGELRLMKLDDIHDSGIGTPSSSYSDNTKKQKAISFLAQPSNMAHDVTMKDYQLVGLNWLHLLYQARTSCILADDMGLGKTCQIIAFLAQLQIEAVDGVHLIIVPGSTLENWLREIARFAPSLTVFAYYGSQNERLDLQEQLEQERESIDVVVTTYDMAVKDNKFMRKIEPAVCVYDEAHQLRNPKSDRYAKLMRIQADFKILLTGTPLQNNLQELIAILAFIMPELFDEKRGHLDFIFKHKASTRNANHGALLSAQRTKRARSMVTPFILRRKKAQVLDLPAKISRVEYCDLSETQVEMYDGLQDEVRQVFADREAGIKKTGGRGARYSINIMMELRKAAIHPLLTRRIYTDKKIDRITSLLLKSEEFSGNSRDRIVQYLTGVAAQSLTGNDFSLHQFCSERDYLRKFALQNDEWMDSGKVQKFKELLQKYVENGDKVLVFSQFTMLMDIMEAVLQTLDIKFMRLDGSTQMDIRQTMIDQFNTQAEITVFMLSTKAGGAGINLASANKVIIFDSGFNPQDDIQAENRAHRVGQTREVEVVRLVSRDTIEEQIHALGVSKLALDDRVAGEGTTATEDKAAEKAGAEAVEQMLKESLQKQEDVKDAFKKGLQSNGIQVD